MRTISYLIAEHDEEGLSHFFYLVECETLHVVTGDEQYYHDVPGVYNTWQQAAEGREELAKLLAY